LRPGVRRLSDETLDDLKVKGYRIFQKKRAFRFGTDSVLLADFAAPKARELVADLGTGSGVLAILMAAHAPGARFHAIEIQRQMAQMAARSVRLNGLSARISVFCADLRDAPTLLGQGGHSLIVCNPPYNAPGASTARASDAERVARQEDGCAAGDIARAASRLLKNGGRLAMVYPAPRLFDLMCAMRAARIEPKRVRMIQNTANSAPKLALIDGVKGGRSALHCMPPLILSEGGAPSAEWRRIYNC
jgi:tRNA1Val (adenine37-N6)-methyltransferase